MRFIFPIIGFCLFFASPAHSQDTLYRSDGLVMPVLLIKVDSVNIRYKKVGDTSSMIYILDKSSVSKIVFRDGHSRKYPQANNGVVIQANPAYYTPDTLLNIFSLNLFDLFFGMVTFNYERSISSGNFSIRVPLTFGFNSGSSSEYYYYPDNGYRDRAFRTGCGFYYYPGPIKKDRYFAGVSFEFGKNEDIINDYEQFKEIWIYSFLLDNGFILQLSRKMTLSFNVAVGLGMLNYTHTFNNYHYKSNELAFDYKAGLSIGYKF